MSRWQRARWRLWNAGVGLCDAINDALAGHDITVHRVPWCLVLHPWWLITGLPITDADWEAAGWADEPWD